MSILPKSLRDTAGFLARLPGIGQKTAHRLAFALLRMPARDVAQFATVLESLHIHTKRCVTCANLCEDTDQCEICNDPQRDIHTVTVVESVFDIVAFETGDIYQGLYHVLHGRIDPLNRVGPDDLTIDLLVQRVRIGTIREVVIATNPDLEGEATATYIARQLADIANIRISRIGYGMPSGGSVEYADYVTLKRAFAGRNTIE